MRRWLASSVVAALAIAGVIFLIGILRFNDPADVAPKPLRPKVELASAGGANQILNDETVMQDQTPLFLPTERNVALRPPKRPEAGRTVLDRDESRFSFSENGLKLGIPMPERVAENAAEVVLSEPVSSHAYGLGRIGAEVVPFSERGGLVEILASGTNRRVLAIELEPATRPPTEKVWRPLEFLGRIDAAGLAGPLVMTHRSDVEEVDIYFRNLLVRTLRIGERLAPGSYRIIVGP